MHNVRGQRPGHELPLAERVYGVRAVRVASHVPGVQRGVRRGRAHGEVHHVRALAARAVRPHPDGGGRREVRRERLCVHSVQAEGHTAPAPGASARAAAQGQAQAGAVPPLQDAAIAASHQSR